MKTIIENKKIKVSETGRDYDFIATVENKTNRHIRILEKNMFHGAFYGCQDCFEIEPRMVRIAR
jgi:hypothetical protein